MQYPTMRFCKIETLLWLDIKQDGLVKSLSKTEVGLTHLEFSIISDVYSLNTMSTGGFAKHVRQVGTVRGDRGEDP